MNSEAFALLNYLYSDIWFLAFCIGLLHQKWHKMADLIVKFLNSDDTSKFDNSLFSIAGLDHLVCIEGVLVYPQ